MELRRMSLAEVARACREETAKFLQRLPSRSRARHTRDVIRIVGAGPPPVTLAPCPGRESRGNGGMAVRAGEPAIASAGGMRYPGPVKATDGASRIVEALDSPQPTRAECRGPSCRWTAGQPADACAALAGPTGNGRRRWSAVP